MTSKTDKVDHEVQEVAPPNAWRIAASRSCKFELQDRDEAFAFGGIKPGDAMLLMDETGDFAWGVRRVFLVRRVAEGSIVYFDRQCDFDEQPIPCSSPSMLRCTGSSLCSTAATVC